MIYLIFRVRKRILGSLKKLVEGARKVGQGDLDKHIDIEGFEEHRQLAESFNEMTAKLQNYIEREKNLRKEAEENLKRWETLVEQDPSLIIIHVDGVIKFINSEGVEIAGAESADDLIGTSIFDFLDKADASKATERIQKIENKNGKTAPTVYKTKRLDGEERYLQVQGVPITYNGQQAIQTVGIDITDHIIYEEELQESVREKSVLLQEIHHRVKNNLAVVTGLMKLQALNSKNEDLTKKLHDSQLRIQSMALIHELLYKSENFSKLKFTDHVRQLVDTIRETIETDASISIEYQLDDVDLNINQAIPCGLILNELVTNTFKHAFQGMESGTVFIFIREEEGVFTLTVADDGKGLPEDFDVQEADTLGMHIVKTLTKQLEASLDYTTRDGSKFVLKFEIDNKEG